MNLDHPYRHGKDWLMTIKKGSYRRRDSQKLTDADDRPRRHRAGNARPEVRMGGIAEAADAWLEGRGAKAPAESATDGATTSQKRWNRQGGMSATISVKLIGQGVEIGVKRWVSRGKSGR